MCIIPREKPLPYIGGDIRRHFSTIGSHLTIGHGKKFESQNHSNAKSAKAFHSIRVLYESAAELDTPSADARNNLGVWAELSGPKLLLGRFAGAVSARG
jgi:hypothetical protein